MVGILDVPFFEVAFHDVGTLFGAEQITPDICLW